MSGASFFKPVSGPKMFQLGSLVVLCSLLTGTSASLLDVLQNLNLDVGLLQETMDWSLVKNNILEALNTLDPDRLNLLLSQNGLGLRINKLSLLNLQAGLSSNGNGIDLKLPVVMDASVSLPLTGFMVHVAISFDLLTPLTIETNAQTGLPTLSVGKCSSDADSFITSVVGRLNSIVY
ncbi:BPI fold-containing family A member 2-like [Peromyscus maniculatus bairdii]|uniref:BPI fold-containing family A member 2-like n=1 Tax=Peromyscus maniculatus bairdii TaxID=230844 RepID=UPI003FD4323D